MTTSDERFFADMTDSLMLDQQDHEAETTEGLREEWGDPTDPRFDDLMWEEIVAVLDEIEREHWAHEAERDLMRAEWGW